MQVTQLGVTGQDLNTGLMWDSSALEEKEVGNWVLLGQGCALGRGERTEEG